MNALDSIRSQMRESPSDYTPLEWTLLNAVDSVMAICDEWDNDEWDVPPRAQDFRDAIFISLLVEP